MTIQTPNGLSDTVLEALKPRTTDKDYENHRYHWQDIHMPYYLPLMAEFLEAVPDSDKPLKVVDCGSGYGLWSLFFADKGHSVAAFDHSEKCLEVLEVWQQAGHYPVTTHQGDLHDLSCFEDNAFDVSFSFSTLHVLDEPLIALREMLRITRPGGYVVMGLSNTGHPMNRLKWNNNPQYKLALTPDRMAAYMGETAKLFFSRDDYARDNRIKVSTGDDVLFHIRAWKKTETAMPPVEKWVCEKDRIKKKQGLRGWFGE